MYISFHTKHPIDTFFLNWLSGYWMKKKYWNDIFKTIKEYNSWISKILNLFFIIGNNVRKSTTNYLFCTVHKLKNGISPVCSACTSIKYKRTWDLGCCVVEVVELLYHYPVNSAVVSSTPSGGRCTRLPFNSIQKVSDVLSWFICF